MKGVKKMTKWNRLLAALVAVVMLLTMPIMTGISRAAADGKTDTAEPMAHTHKWSGPAWTFRYTLADGSKVDVTDGLDPDGNEFDANKAYWIDTRYATFTCESCGQKKQVQVSGQTYEVVEDDPNATPSIEFSCPLLLNHAEVTFNGQTYATTEPLKLDSEHANAGWFLFCKDDSHGFKNEYRFTEKDENGDYVLEVEDLPLDVEVWVVYAVNCPETNGQGNDLPYHPFGKAGDMEHRLYTTEETSGHVKIYFNPECHDEWKDFYEVGFCYIEKIPDEPEEPIATITIQGESETVLYDGEEHTAIGFHGMIQNELMDKEFTSDHATDTNEHEAVFRGAWIDGNASEYRIVATTADPTEVEAGVYPNTITDVKVYVNDVDVTALYSVYAYNGKLTILSEPIATITIQGESETVLYDGQEHTVIGFHGMIQNQYMDKEFTSDHAADTNEHEAVFRGAWIDGNANEYRIVATTADPAETAVGTYANTVTNVKVYVNDVDVTALYSVISNDGMLNIVGEPAFKTQSLVLEGRIGINFFLYLPEADCYEYEGVAFEIDNTDGADAFVPFSSDMPTNANGYYQFTYYVRSIEMADTITATLKYKLNGDEKTLVKTYSVKQYFETFDNYTFLFSELEQAMTKATADYGHYVQAFLETTRTWVIGVDYAEMDKYYTDYTADDISAAQTGLADYVTAKTTGSNMEKITYTLVLDSDMELRVYFKPAEDYTGTFTFTVNGETVTEDGEKISAKLLSDGRYLVAIKNVAAHELYRVFEVKAVGDDGVESSMTVSALSYVNAMMTAYAGNEKAINAAVAIYRYAMAAKALRP
jgi:hypothetical protein